MNLAFSSYSPAFYAQNIKGLKVTSKQGVNTKRQTEIQSSFKLVIFFVLT